MDKTLIRSVLEDYLEHLYRCGSAEEQERVNNAIKELDMKKYRVMWYEYHDPLNWGETREEGIKNLYESLPTKDIHPDPNEDDGWVECVCIDEFEAVNIEQALEYVRENYDIPNDVFSIFDEEDYIVATEEGLEIPKRKGNLK